MSVLKDYSAILIDAASFGFINLLQIRARSGHCSRTDFLSYVAEHETKSPDSYFALPDCGDFTCEGSGSWESSSPHPSSGIKENDHLHVDFWLGPKGWNSPIMIMLHGVMSVSDVGYRLWARQLNRLGWSAAFFHLPYHYSRRPTSSWSGEMALSSNFIRTAEGIRQAVIELRWVIQTWKRKGVPHVGLWATSYGGWIASLLLGIEPLVKTAWLLEPITDAEHAVWHSPATITLRYQARRAGISPEDAKKLHHLLCPSKQLPSIDPSHIILAAGKFDRIAPPHSLRKLHELWHGSHYLEFPQGHVGYQLMPRTLEFAQKNLPHLF